MKYEVNSDRETKRLAKECLHSFNGGDVIGLVGDLGAGKTTFTQGLGKALGIKTTITSPTFVLMKIYPVKHNTINTLCHIDAYRLKNLEDLQAIGALEYINSPDCLTIIEWANNVKDILPKSTKYINITHNNNSRIFEI